MEWLWKRAGEKIKVWKLTSVILILSVILGLAVSSPLMAQKQHRYPRLANFHFGKAPAEWYAKFDVIMCSQDYDKIKAINPNVYTFTSRDWNVWEIGEAPPEEWFVRDSHKNKVWVGYGYLMDISNYCGRSATYGGKRYNEYLIQATIEQTDNPVFDGFFCQGVWDHPYGTQDVDLDKNGVNDWTEHGRGWLEDVWLEGIHKTVAAIRAQFVAKNKILILNTGRFHDFEWENSNGLMLEHDHTPFHFSYFKQMYDSWMKTAPEPHVLFVDTEAETADNYRDMRYMLTATLMGDGYFSFTDKGSGEHAYKKYYDEFDLDLGFPTSSALELANGCWVRFFDNGVVITNPTESNRTIADSDLRRFSQYAGPYYRFEGGQDHKMNNGSQLGQVTLAGAPGSNGTFGDGIILLKSPRVVIADIIIDDSEAATAPGQSAASLTGSWAHEENSGDGFYQMAYKPWNNIYRYARSSSGRGENTASYVPNINVAGIYEIYEWHGYLGNSPGAVQEATNVPYTISYSSGQKKTGTIDQSVNYGQWNSLGTFYLDLGTANSVTINNNANGPVIADAFKFVFKEKEQDAVLPNAPQQLLCDIKTENSLHLTWLEPLPASDGDVASAYEVFRDNSQVATTLTTAYLDAGLSENRSYNYEVYAIDNVGNRSQSPARGTFATLADMVKPTIVAVTPTDLMTVEVAFSEAVDRLSAETIGNYAIDHNINIASATLLEDQKTVRLKTSAHVVGETYTIIINNIRDRAQMANVISPNSQATYTGNGGPISIVMAVDDDYKLYVNGVLVGSGNEWETSQQYTVPSIAGKNVIAVKCHDQGERAGLIAEIDYHGKHYVSNETWRVSTAEQTGWEQVNFNDKSWPHATAYGVHGSALPWAQYRNVPGIAVNSNVQWIWSADNLNDDLVFLRLVISLGDDTTPPAPPTGVTIRNP